MKSQPRTTANEGTAGFEARDGGSGSQGEAAICTKVRGGTVADRHPRLRNANGAAAIRGIGQREGSEGSRVEEDDGVSSSEGSQGEGWPTNHRK